MLYCRCCSTAATPPPVTDNPRVDILTLRFRPVHPVFINI